LARGAHGDQKPDQPDCRHHKRCTEQVDFEHLSSLT
jgi:hypothetical protein